MYCSWFQSFPATAQEHFSSQKALQESAVEQLNTEVEDFWWSSGYITTGYRGLQDLHWDLGF